MDYTESDMPDPVDHKSKAEEASRDIDVQLKKLNTLLEMDQDLDDMLREMRNR